MSAFARNIRHVLFTDTGGAYGRLSRLSQLGRVTSTLAEVPIHRRRANAIPLHERGQRDALCPYGAEFVTLVWRQRFRAPTMYPGPLCLRNTLSLTLCAQFQCKLGDDCEHAEQQTSGRRVGIHLVVKTLEMDPCAGEKVSNLTEVQR